ncbi:hypothetical protein AHIS1636_40360 [Arthrobacter mangrovi]|uniref:Uncharacterized protein n=1 Tax=Arthrobacter mangrovi TaxID=2966350 RepID=A0ABQ5N024_9MICC|nr:hypothetical protein AHIS1636_40360 [Arthrobacter mangrovi]
MGGNLSYLEDDVEFPGMVCTPDAIESINAGNKGPVRGCRTGPPGCPGQGVPPR